MASSRFVRAVCQRTKPAPTPSLDQEPLATCSAWDRPGHTVETSGIEPIKLRAAYTWPRLLRARTDCESLSKAPSNCDSIPETTWLLTASGIHKSRRDTDSSLSISPSLFTVLCRGITCPTLLSHDKTFEVFESVNSITLDCSGEIRCQTVSTLTKRMSLP